MIRRWLAPALGVLGCLMAWPLAAAPLKFCFEDAPLAPWTLPDGSGLNIALLHQVEKLTGEQFVFTARPWKRCLEELRTAQVDGVIGTADGPERRSIGVFPMRADGSLRSDQALFQDSVNVFILADSKAAWNGLTLSNPREFVITQRGYRVAEELRARGSKVLDNVRLAEEAFRAMLAGVADVAVLQGLDAEQLVRHDPRFAARIVQARQPYVVYAFYLMVGKKTYEADPRRIDAIWNAIGNARKTPDYRRLEAAELAKLRRD
ncbi:ABC transporter substrate-binding protein [Massilia sp. TS11]|uniref:substrate-binding periplasmic protein n=1 Tax=Massilia sp. TS11 TaxID=2908003 RepID=UPI001EDC8303|nr:transporter substrate-binding domain-containing protein [Massilia sp. TS11]MCG2585185.1 transporter substrate-binding domain-containing protein [Massilia sp. TS11]